MNFKQAIASGLRKYVVFSGRASRSEYGYWILALFLCGLLFAVIVLYNFAPILNVPFISLNDPRILAVDRAIATDGKYYGLFNLAVFLPSLSVSVRRLHDVDRSSWWALIIVGLGLLIVGSLRMLIMVPIIGIVIALILICMRGTVGANRYGPDPLEERFVG